MGIDEITQLNYMINELLFMVQEKKNLSVEKLEELSDQHEIFSYLKQTYGFKMQCTNTEDMSAVQHFLDYEVYISQRDAEDKKLENNGLLYLIRLLTDKLQNIAYDYKFNLIDALEELSACKKKSQ